MPSTLSTALPRALPAPSVISAPSPPAWLDRNAYPFSAKRFATAEGALSYVDEGRGRPLFLVHGTPSWSFEWRHVVRALRGERRVVAPDHLGFGLSDKPDHAGYAPEDHAKRLLALFDSLDLRDVTLVVHDFGGPIGLPLALERRERIARLVVVNSWMWPLGGDARVARLSRFVRSPLGHFLYTWVNVSPRFLVPASFADPGRLTPAIHAQYLGPFRARRDRMAPWVLGTRLTGSDPYYAALFADRPKLTGLPVTLVWGLRDPAFGSDVLERWLATFPSANVVRIADAGHFPQEEAPEAVIRALSN